MDNPETKPVAPSAEVPKTPKKSTKVDVQTFLTNWAMVLASKADPEAAFDGESRFSG